MIPRSRLIALLAVLVALATHAAAMLDFSRAPEVKIQGGGDVGVAALGNSFRDMTAGSTPSPTPEKAKPTKPETVTRPERLTQQAPAQATTLQPAPQQDQLSALAPTSMRAIKPAPSAQTTPSKLKPSDQTTPPVKPIKDQLKPEKPRKKQKKQAAAPKGNSAKTERIGQATGKSKKKTSRANASGRKAAQQGNAAASTYVGLVLRKVHRARRKSVKMRGTARVSFRIADNGTLTRIAISQSSGSARLDKIALSQVRAAAPFPRPPAGAKRNFAVDIKGK